MPYSTYRESGIRQVIGGGGAHCLGCCVGFLCARVHVYVCVATDSGKFTDVSSVDNYLIYWCFLSLLC